MLAVENVSIQFGGRTLFSDLSFVVRAHERISLAGPNGAGKSTLLKIIYGLEGSDGGAIKKAKAATVGYLPQEGVHHEGRTLFEEVQTAFDDVVAMQTELGKLNDKLGELDPASAEYADALEVFGDLQLRLESHDVAKMKPRIEIILAGLGFSKTDLDRGTGEFSGGWQMRIALSKLLLQEPSVLLLDEPTNHLDIESQRWLEQYLQNYHGAIILICHDRAFLDMLTNRTVAFDGGRVEQYAGNYSFYLKERDARREQLERSYKNQQREIEKQQKLIDRFRSKASKASMVQSRIKQLEKMDLIEIEREESGIAFRFPQPRPSGHTVISLENVAKSYGDLEVFKDLDFEITKGDRIAIVGVNGAGKSTFSRILSGVEEVTCGEVKLGHHVDVAHFSQNHADELNPKRQVLQTVEETASREAALNLRTLLGCFLFRGDDVFKRVEVLSGGERSRLALARLLLKPANFLVLDEPTNHLDLQSQEVLQRALSDYTGTYVIVSHNRSFLDPVVTKTLEFLVGQPPRLYSGNVSYYLEKKAEEEAAKANLGARAVPVKADASGPGANRKEQRRLESQRRQEKSQKLKPLQAKLEEVEASISELESLKVEMTKTMTSPEFFTDAAKAKVFVQEFKKAESDLENSYSAWAEVSDELEKVEAEFGDS
jgi:ATP-binding cassette subfamily F protein 3